MTAYRLWCIPQRAGPLECEHMKLPDRHPMVIRGVLLLRAMFVTFFIFSASHAQARDADQDCQILKQVISDAPNSFRNLRDEAQVHDMQSAKKYPASVTFADSQWCSVVVSRDFFNENYNCDLRNTTVNETVSMIRQCLGETAVPDPKHQDDHFRVFRLATEHGGGVNVFQGAFAGLVTITVDAAEPD